MKRRTTGFIFLIVMLVSLALVGCFGGGTKSYILTGTVTESDTEVPLAGAEVKIGEKETITNAYGLYELKGVPGGSGTLRVTLDGYEPNEQDVTVSADAEIDVDLETQAEDLNLGGVSVGTTGVMLRLMAAIRSRHEESVLDLKWKRTASARRLHRHEFWPTRHCVLV